MVTIGRTIGLEWADEYCKYLNMLGISARKIKENDPDWIDHSIPGALYRTRIGALKIDEGSIHQLDFLRVDGKGSTYFHHYSLLGLRSAKMPRI